MEVIVSYLILIGVNLGLAAVLGAFFGATRLLNEGRSPLPEWLRGVIGAIIFGVLSVIGSATSVNYNNTLINVRDGPIVSGGIWFGPVVAMGAAIIGTGYRFLLGGPTLLPCCIATLLGGVITALFYIWCRPLVNTITATMLAILIGLIQILLIMVLTPDDIGYYIILGTTTAYTLIMMSALSVAIFSWSFELFIRPKQKYSATA